jgi:L-malate glycosyltransferase
MMESIHSPKTTILFIIDFIYGLSGGTETQLVRIINNLDKRKYNIRLLCLKNTLWIKKHASDLKCGIKIVDINKLKNPMNMVTCFKIFLYLKKQRPDIVMTFFPLSNILGVFVARIANMKIIISTRRDYGLWLQKRGLIFLRIANIFVKRIVTNSYKVKQLTSRVESYDSSKIDVIYNGIEVDSSRAFVSKSRSLLEKYGIPLNNKVIGIVAGLKPMKKHTVFIKAAKLVLESRPDVSFFIVGDGPLRRELKTLTGELKLINDIHFVGSQEDIVPFLSTFDIGINCSSNEGLSNAIMEYMAYGVPCIVSRAGGNEELVKKGVNGYTFELDNYHELAELIIKLLGDNGKQRQFALKSIEIASNILSVDKMVKIYDNYFKQLLESN